MKDINIYVSTKTNEDGQSYAIVQIDEEEIIYTSIKSLGYRNIDKLNTEILALDKALEIALRLILADCNIVIYHSLDYAITEDNSIKQGDTDNPQETFYLALELSVLDSLDKINQMEKEIDLVKVAKDENIANIYYDDNDLGYYVDVEDVQIPDRLFAEKFVDAILD